MPVVIASNAFTITCELVHTTVARSGSFTRDVEKELSRCGEERYSRTLTSIRDVAARVEIESKV